MDPAPCQKNFPASAIRVSKPSIDYGTAHSSSDMCSQRPRVVLHPDRVPGALHARKVENRSLTKKRF
jgi:hypothetical protein